MKSHANQQQSQQQLQQQQQQQQQDQQQQQQQQQQQLNQQQQSQTGQQMQHHGQTAGQHQQLQHQLLQGKQTHDPNMAPGDPNMTAYDPQQLHLATGGGVATGQEDMDDMDEMDDEEEDVGGQALFECEVCEASFWNQEQLAEHLVTSGHRNKQVSTVNVAQLANDWSCLPVLEYGTQREIGFAG